MQYCGSSEAFMSSIGIEKKSTSGCKSSSAGCCRVLKEPLPEESGEPAVSKALKIESYEELTAFLATPGSSSSELWTGELAKGLGTSVSVEVFDFFARTSEP